MGGDQELGNCKFCQKWSDEYEGVKHGAMIDFTYCSADCEKEYNNLSSSNLNPDTQIKSNQIKSNQIKSNQIKSNQIKSNQIKSNQINLSTITYLTKIN